jgi:hypothetical protein
MGITLNFAKVTISCVFCGCANQNGSLHLKGVGLLGFLD